MKVRFGGQRKKKKGFKECGLFKGYQIDIELTKTYVNIYSEMNS